MYLISAKFALVLVLFQISFNVAIGYSFYKIEKFQARTESFTHLVQLGYKTNYGLMWQCSGALLSPRKVIAAANCINTKQFGNPTVVRINNRQINIDRYDRNSEIVLLFLQEPYPLKTRVCLSSDIDIETATAAGWGGLSFENQLHGTLNKEISTVQLKTFESFEDTIKLRPPKGSVCVTDRGGPLQVRSRNPGCFYDIVGVLRNWDNCGDDYSFGEYILLASYNEWIENTN